MIIPTELFVGVPTFSAHFLPRSLILSYYFSLFPMSGLPLLQLLCELSPGVVAVGWEQQAGCDTTGSALSQGLVLSCPPLLHPSLHCCCRVEMSPAMPSLWLQEGPHGDLHPPPWPEAMLSTAQPGIWYLGLKSPFKTGKFAASLLNWEVSPPITI